MPGGDPPVRFRQTEPDAIIHLNRRPEHFASFENAQHDYPQTVSYRRDGERLTARIAGAGEASPIEFRYRRIRCPAALRP
jgi:hypothetical protein